MKKKKSTYGQTTGVPHNHIPDIEIIDLELDGNIGNSGQEPFLSDDCSDLMNHSIPAEENAQDPETAGTPGTTPDSGTMQDFNEMQDPEDIQELQDSENIQELQGSEDMQESQELQDSENIQEFQDSEDMQDDSGEYDEEAEEAVPKRGLRSFLNIHVLLLLVFLIFVVCIFLKFKNWGVHIDLSQLEKDESGTYLDVLDQFLPLTDAEGRIIPTEDVDTIVAFGNAPFADDRDSEDNLANLIADSTGATVYNCSVSGSYLASQWPFFDSSQAPMDAYCFYWLVTLATSGANSHYYSEAAAALGDAVPPEAQEVYDTLTSLDFSTVDVVTVMYDASDYLMGHEMYDDANPTNIQQFTGNLEAGIELLQDTYPNIRIIVMSPTYAYAVNENGEYVSSDMFKYEGLDVLSTYVIKEYASCASRSVSFIDHLYGTITEDNARDYLTDNLHLNAAGRKKVAERFLTALNYYNED